VKNVPEANANATQALMNARGVDTFESPSRSHPKWLKYWDRDTHQANGSVCALRAIDGQHWGLVELFKAEFERGAPVVQQSTTERAR